MRRASRAPGRLQERFDRVHGSSSGSEVPVYTAAPSCCPRSLSMIARRRGNPLITRPRVAIVGANFGGLRAAQELGSEFDVTVFDPSPWFEWLPNIHELVSRAKRPADLRLPRKRLVAAAGHRFVRDAVTAIDARRGTLTTAGGTVQAFDFCIVAAGGVNATYGVRGVERYAMPFRSVEQCDAIGRRLAALMKGRKPRSIVIAGGGFAGVEALGEILRRYRSRDNLTLHIVEAGPGLMSGVSPKIDAAVRKHVRAYDVQIHARSPVAAITPTGVRLQGGRRLRSDLTIWTGGGDRTPAAARCRTRAEAAAVGARRCNAAQSPLRQRVRDRRCGGIAGGRSEAGIPRARDGRMRGRQRSARRCWPCAASLPAFAHAAAGGVRRS